MIQLKLKLMKSFSNIFLIFILTGIITSPVPMNGNSKTALIPENDINKLEAKRIEAGKATSSSRKKLAIRRVIREAETLIQKHSIAPNRYELISTLFRSQQMLVSLDNSSTNRKAFLATCSKLASAPDEYADLRLDADLLLTQTESARRGGDSHDRSNALRPLVERYRDTDVEAKVIRIAMIMALELGNNKLVNDLRGVIARRMPGNLDLINFQRDKLAGQVFGVPFMGTFPWGKDNTARFPMDFLGTTTAIYFWSKEDGGLDDLKELAEAWKIKISDSEVAALGRFRFVSMNLDDLPDGGESILREHGLDWPALRMEGGSKNPIYKAYCRFHPRVLRISPTGYAAIYLTSSRDSRGYERNLQSWLARQWTKADYNSHLQSIFAGEFLVIDTEGPFDPSAPPEWKAVSKNGEKILRTEESIPWETLQTLQECFIPPPLRYNISFAQMVENFERADKLCHETISSYSNAPDLWIVRNRRIVALCGLWKLKGEYSYFAKAVQEAKTTLESKLPKGVDVIARFCLSRESLRNEVIDSETLIRDFAKTEEKKASAPELALAALLALDVADRKLHEEYRRAYLDEYAEHPSMWTATAFFLDRYHRYWMYNPPFVAGWTYGRRQGHFLAVGEPEDANRSLQLELNALDGKTVRFPKQDNDKWTVVSFAQSAEQSNYLARYAKFVTERPIDNINLVHAVLDDDANATLQVIETKKTPDFFPTMLLSEGIDNPVTKKLGITLDGEKVEPNRRVPNITILRPDGSIALALSGSTMKNVKSNVIQNAIEIGDEEMVNDALEREDIEEAKRLAFLFAPEDEPTPNDIKKKPAKKISDPHLRSRAKVYLAMNELVLAERDAQDLYLSTKQKAGYLSMQTSELTAAEAFKEKIRKKIEETKQ
jgi:hypothetical protein